MWLCSAAFSVACLGSSDLCHKLALFCQNGLYRNGPWCQFPFSIIIKIRKYCIEISKVLIYGFTNFQYRFKFSELWPMISNLLLVSISQFNVETPPKRIDLKRTHSSLGWCKFWTRTFLGLSVPCYSTLR